MGSDPLDHQNETSSVVTREVVAYIKDNYKTGKKFKDLVLEQRIEHAKELLTGVRYKTYEVAEIIGM